MADGSNRHSRALSLALALLCAAALMTAFGCASRFLDPGPHPAKVKVSFNAEAGVGLVRRALEVSQLTQPMTLPGRFHSITGPFWDYGLYLVRKDGSYSPLGTQGEAELQFIRSDSLKAGAVFLAPPGPARLRLIVECYLRHEWDEGFGPSSYEPVAVAQFTRDWQGDLKPGQALDWGLGDLGRPDE